MRSPVLTARLLTPYLLFLFNQKEKSMSAKPTTEITTSDTSLTATITLVKNNIGNPTLAIVMPLLVSVPQPFVWLELSEVETEPLG